MIVPCTKQYQIDTANSLDISLDNYDPALYTEGQLREIRLGLLYGVDTSIYSDCKIPALQMAEIRLALQHNIPQDKLTPLFQPISGARLKQIRLGIESGLNVDLYAYSDYNSKEMAVIRLGLMEGNNIIPYICKGMSVIKMELVRDCLRYDLEPKVITDSHISDYEANFIVTAMLNRFNYRDLPLHEFSKEQFKELEEGLIENVDITRYAHPNLSPQEMCRIKKGLIYGLDIEQDSSNLDVEITQLERQATCSTDLFIC